LTISPPVVHLGVQVPRLSTVPARRSSAGSEAVELAASAGLLLDPWQELVLEEALGERSDGRWSAFEVGLVVSRQNGKGSILEARELAGLFLFDEQLILHSAHEFKTAQEAFRRVLGLIQNTPDLERRVAKVRTSHGDEGVELRNGARLRFVARSTGSGRGFSGDCVILDEAYHLPADSLSALLPTLSARPNPQLWYTSSAPLVDSEVLRRLRRRGMAGESRLCFMEWSAPEDVDLDDREAWAQANPALGIRIVEEFIEAERAALPPEGFARERLGIAPDPDVVSQVIPLAAWQSCVDGRSSFVGEPMVVVDVTPDRASASIAAGGVRADGLPHVELIDCQPGVAWVVPRLQALRSKPRRVLVDATGPAGSLIAEGQAHGVEIEAVSTADHAKACGYLHDAVLEGRMRHLGDPRMEKALLGAVRRDVGDGAWLWSRKSSLLDISPLVACTIALWAASEQVASPGFVNLNDLLDDDGGG
jgi:phage terminase large subunit-like protein